MPNLGLYRQEFMKLIGPTLFGTTTAGSDINTLYDTALLLDATASAETYDGWFIWRPNAALAADRERVVYTYDPNRGSLVPSAPWTNAPGASEAYELYAVVPPGQVGIDLVNHALRETYVVHEVTLAATAQVTRHLLSTTYPWLTDPKWIRRVGYLSTGDNREIVDPYLTAVPGIGKKRAEKVWFEHHGFAFTASETLYFEVVAPAYALCKPVSGNWGDQSGLALETDQAIPQDDWVAWGALLEAWQRFGEILEAQANNRILRDRAVAAAKFSELTDTYLDVPDYDSHPVEQAGPSWR